MSTITEVEHLTRQISTAELNLAVLNENLHEILHDRIFNYFQNLVRSEQTDIDQRRIWAAYSTEQQYVIQNDIVVFTTMYHGVRMEHRVLLSDLL